jgi:PhnB protein
MVKAVPNGMSTLTTQLSVEGAAAAIDFMKKVFNAEELQRAPDPSGKKIWHALVKIGGSSLFINDLFPEMGASKPTNATLWVYSDDVDAMFKRAVAAGATPTMPVDDMFWGDRMGRVKDAWGNDWVVAQRVKDLSPDEIKKAEAEFIAKQKS